MMNDSLSCAAERVCIYRGIVYDVTLRQMTVTVSIVSSYRNVYRAAPQRITLLNGSPKRIGTIVVTDTVRKFLLKHFCWLHDYVNFRDAPFDSVTN